MYVPEEKDSLLKKDPVLAPLGLGPRDPKQHRYVASPFRHSRCFNHVIGMPSHFTYT